jgi:hypothetical protein
MFKVQKQILDLYYHDEENARPFQDHAKRIYYAKILPEMEAILEKHDVRQNIIRINALELDLGKIDEEEFDAEWPKKFAAEFERQLLKRLLLIQNEKSTTEDELIPITKQVSEIFEHYLQNGTLPWNADYVKHTPRWMMENLLENHPNELIRILKKYGSKPNVIRRIVLQFPEKLLIRTVERMHPTEAQFIVETVNEIDITRKKESFVKTDSIHFRFKLWEFVFSYILNDRGSYFNTKSYVKSMLFSIAGHFNMERELLIKQFYQAAFLLKKDISLSNDLWQIISEIHEEVEAKENGITSFEKSFFEKILKEQEGKQKSIEIPLTEENTRHILEHLIFQPAYHGMIRSWLGEKGGDTEFQKKIGRAIHTQKQFEKLVRIIDAQHADYIIGFSKHLQDGQEKRYIFPVSSTQFRQDQYQVIITVLLVDRGSYFNKKSFVKQVLQKLSVQYGITYKQLLASLVGSVPSHMKSMAQLPDVIQLLEDLQQEENKAIQNNTDKQPSIPPDELEKIIEYWAKNKVMPTWVAELTGLQKIPFQNLWMQLLAEAHLHENWIHHFLRDENHISFLQEMMGTAGITHTFQRLIPQNVYQEIYQFTNILDEVFATENLVVMDLKTYERKKTVFLFSHLYALRNQEVDINTWAEKALVYFARVWQIKLPDLLQQCILVSGDEKTISPTVNAVLQKIKTRQHGKAKPTNTGDKAEALMDEFLSRTAEAPLASSIYSDDLYNTLVQLQRVSTHHVVVFLQKTFSADSFYAFINKTNHRKILSFFKEIVLKDHGYFLSVLMQDMLFILHKAKIPLYEIENILSKSIIYTWFTNKKREKEYVENMLYFISDAKKSNPKEIRQVLRETAIQHKLDLKSKIILHLSTEEILKKEEKAEKEAENIKHDSKLVIPYTTDKEETIIDTVAVKNAGLVLVWPFISLYFERLNLTKSGAFIDENTQHRAVHLLQYLANQQCDYPEHGLALPKILCGMHPSHSITPSIEITDDEKNMAESLLGGIIQQWSILKNTSPAVLRESFLNRSGLLYQKEKGWELHVEPQSFDVLLDKRPWGIQIIKLTWMKTTLYCKWR